MELRSGLDAAIGIDLTDGIGRRRRLAIATHDGTSSQSLRNELTGYTCGASDSRVNALDNRLAVV